MDDLHGWETENKLACKYGWQPVIDLKRGPGGWCLFRKDEETIWLSSSMRWIRARLVPAGVDPGTMHVNHSKHATLEEALKGTP